MKKNEQNPDDKPKSKQKPPTPIRPDDDVEQMLKDAVQMGNTINDLANQALRRYLPEILEMQHEERVALLKEFRKKYGKKKDQS